MRRRVRRREHGQTPVADDTARRGHSGARRRDGVPRAMDGRRGHGLCGARAATRVPDVCQAAPAWVEHRCRACRDLCGIAGRARGRFRLRHLDSRRARSGREHRDQLLGARMGGRPAGLGVRTTGEQRDPQLCRQVSQRRQDQGRGKGACRRYEELPAPHPRADFRLVDQTHPGNRDGIVSRHRRRGRDPS